MTRPEPLSPTWPCVNCVAVFDSHAAWQAHALGHVHGRPEPLSAEPLSLDAAWAEAEAALPEGWGLSAAMEREDRQATARAGRIAFAWPVEVVSVDGPTAAAALHALAERLRERKGDQDGK